jgi:hypothetical protein
MTNIYEYDNGNYFYLSYMPAYNYDGDLGLGGNTMIVRFQSAEGRMYYKQSIEYQEKYKQIISQLESELAYLKTTKGANENLRRVRAANRKSN